MWTQGTFCLIPNHINHLNLNHFYAFTRTIITSPGLTLTILVEVLVLVHFEIVLWTCFKDCECVHVFLLYSLFFNFLLVVMPNFCVDWHSEFKKVTKWKSFPQVQSVLRRHWNQYRMQFGNAMANAEALRSTSYTASSITEVQGCYSIDGHSEHLNGKSCLETDKSENSFNWACHWTWRDCILIVFKLTLPKSHDCTCPEFSADAWWK